MILGLAPSRRPYLNQWWPSCMTHVCVNGPQYVNDLLLPGTRLNIKASCQYRNSHFKDSTYSRSSYLYNGNPHTWKNLYIEKGILWILFRFCLLDVIVSNFDYLCTNEDSGLYIYCAIDEVHFVTIWKELVACVIKYGNCREYVLIL